MKSLPRNLREAAWFLWRNYPPAKDWGRSLLWKYLGWHGNRDSICVVRDENKHAVGVGCARLVMAAEDGGIDCYAWDDEGATIFVDIAAVTNPKAFTILFLQLLKRFGRRDWIAFRRLRDMQDGTTRIYGLEHLRERIIGKELYYGRKQHT